MIVTIDGPAGAGKSSVARALAKRLNFRFLDTGAMYRAVALAALRQNIDVDEFEKVAEIAGKCDLQLDDENIWLNGENVSDEIRSVDVTRSIHAVADNVKVRELLVKKQREIAGDDDFVTEGRDQGSIVFPDACCKIYLSASPKVRAERRQKQLADRGNTLSFEAVLADQNERDKRDSSRPIGRLFKTDDAIEVNTDGMSESEVIQRLSEIVAETRIAKQC